MVRVVDSKAWIGEPSRVQMAVKVADEMTVNPNIVPEIANGRCWADVSSWSWDAIICGMKEQALNWIRALSE